MTRLHGYLLEQGAPATPSAKGFQARLQGYLLEQARSGVPQIWQATIECGHFPERPLSGHTGGHFAFRVMKADMSSMLATSMSGS